jgi:hypothetical protein
MKGDFRKMQGGGNRGLAKSHQISIAWNGVSLLKRAGRSRRLSFPSREGVVIRKAVARIQPA